MTRQAGSASDDQTSRERQRPDQVIADKPGAPATGSGDCRQAGSASDRTEASSVQPIRPDQVIADKPGAPATGQKRQRPDRSVSDRKGPTSSR